MIITTVNIGTVLSPFHIVTQLIFLTDANTTPCLQMRQLRPAQSYAYMRNKDFNWAAWVPNMHSWPPPSLKTKGKTLGYFCWFL